MKEIRIDLGTLMDLVEAAEKAELKLRMEYVSQVGADDLSHPLESWAEGERLRHALDAMRFSILIDNFKARQTTP